MLKVVVTQFHDNILGSEIVVPPLKGETAEETLKRKIKGGEKRGWKIELIEDGFHAWKEYTDGDGTFDRPNRKDRYFEVVD